MAETILDDGKIHEMKLFGDSPTTKDELGFDPYANILLDVIENFDAESPLTIGIHGKWGSGKTSLMRMLENKLNRSDESNVVDAKIRLTIIHRSCRNIKANMRRVFEWLLNKDSKWMRMLEKWLDEGGEKNSVKTIWFNAWAYGRDESIGLALLQQITVELKKEKKFQKKIKKLSKNIGKLLADAALRKTTGATLKEVEKFSNRFKDNIEIKNTLRDDFKSVIDECLQDRYLFGWNNVPENDGERLSRYLMNYHDITWAESAEISKSDDGKIIRISNDGNSAEITMGAREEKATLKVNDARTHNLKVKKEHGKLNIYQNNRLVVFIDDLDRCLPEKTVEILEVMKLFLDVPKCVFVIGVAKDVIEKGIEDIYKTNEQKNSILGKDYINKIIQVPFTIPPIREDVMEGFIKNLGIEREELGYVDIVAKGTGCNTRKVKMFLNTLRIRRAIAERTGWRLKADLLAKLYTVEYLFPEFYDDVKVHTDQQLFYKLERLAVGDLYFSWDNIPGYDGERLLRYLTSYHDIAWAESAEISKIDEFLFSWDDISVDGAEKLLRYLMNYHDIAWAESAEISKFSDGTIRISKDENSAEIMTDKKKKKVVLKTSDGITYDLKAKQENGKLNIYIGDKTIRISKDENSAEITIDEKKEKAALKIGNITTHVMEVKQENDELKICDRVPKELEKEFANIRFEALEKHNKNERLKSLLRDEPHFGRTDIGPYIYLSETLSETETPLPEATKSDEPVLNELLSEDPVKRGAAADSINNMSTTEKQRLLKIVILKLEKGDDFERRKAAPALGKIGDANAVEPLIGALHDEDDIVSENVASALGEIGDKRAIEPLIKTSKDATDARVRMAAEDALGKIGGEKAVGTLIGVLGIGNKTVLDKLLGEDYQETHDIHWKMYHAAKWINNKMLSSEKRQILNVVIAKLRVEDAGVCRNAAEALGRIGDEHAVNPLKEVLREKYEDAGVRRNAAEALGRIGDEHAVDLLKEALKDEHENAFVRRNAAEALGKIKDRQNKLNREVKKDSSEE